MSTDACVALVTCSSKEEAESIAKTVVNEHLAACVNLIGAENPLQSFYYWEGQLQQEPECLLMIKTQIDRLPALEMRIKALHSYTVPEFIVLPVLAGSREYLDWVRQSVICPSSTN